MLTAEEATELDTLLTQPPDFLYATDPLRWMVDVLGIPESTLQWSLHECYADHVWDGTVDPLVVICQALADGKDCGVESATGTGKTYLAAGLALWFVACFKDALVVTTAPKEQQLATQLWKEIGKHWPRFHARYPQASMVTLRVRLKDGAAEQESWAILGYACGVGAVEESATKAQGFHAAHMLIITEETPGIDQAVMAAFENTCTGDHNLRLSLGNPNNQLDALHKFCLQPSVVHVIVSALDHPNVVSGQTVIPGAVGPQSIARRKVRYGETSPIYQSRVRGVSPEQASDALIRLEWLKASALRYEARKLTKTLPTVISGKGVDVANSEHGDKACIADYADNALVRLTAFPCPNANKLGTQIVAELKQDQYDIDPQTVGIDGIGVGAGTVNECRRLGKMVVALIASASPMQMMTKERDGEVLDWAPDVNVFNNLRSQMYWQMREDLRLNRVDIPQDDELWEELTAPTFVDEPKTIIESKDDIKERLGRSPDKADAVVMGNWVRKRSKASLASRAKDDYQSPLDFTATNPASPEKQRPLTQSRVPVRLPRPHQRRGITINVEGF